MIFIWFGRLNYKRISDRWAVKRIFVRGKPLPIMRICRSMIWKLPDGYFMAKKLKGLSDEETLAEVIDSITRELKKENPDINITGIKIHTEE